jgi:predicted RNA binding protein YcfA (HicA-like mRNA interferase family)
MKRREVEKRFEQAGWTLKRHDANHDIWQSPDKKTTEKLTRHPKFNDRLAQGLFKKHGI